MNQKLKHNIILIGFMGSGKTSAGMWLAERLTYQFKDSDQLIEKKAGDTINHIFAVYGEEYFRNMETDLIKDLIPTLNNSVISTGGGLPIREQNAKLLKELGYVVFLKATKQTTVDRLQGDATRPLLQGEDLEKKVERMLEIRTPIYEKAAHKTITTDGRSIQEVAELIMESYMKQIY
ncbi:MAG TPA: shikimate kinase [Mobilitalea sp.]|nr:shikimate kinase [Mobilitalea sp.]